MKTEKNKIHTVVLKQLKNQTKPKKKYESLNKI